MRYRTQAELDAAVRSQMASGDQLEKFDQLMATGTWKVNKSITNHLGTVCWLEPKNDGPCIGLDLRGRVHRPIKGKGVVFSRRTLERIY